jgi:hypothetical protein
MHERPLARSEGVLVERLDDQVVVYDSVSRTAHCLSDGTAAVWELCDGRRSAADIASELGVEVDEVTRALQALGDARLLASFAVAQHGLSRRDAAKRFAKIGAAAISAPLIYSIAIPHAAAAASGTTGGGTDLCVGKNCDDNNNACVTGSCDPITGDCVFTPVVCNDDNICTTDTCEPQKGCVFTPLNCDDDNPCTIDTCDPRVGCVHTAVQDGTPCNGGTCQAGVCTA